MSKNFKPGDSVFIIQNTHATTICGVCFGCGKVTLSKKHKNRIQDCARCSGSGKIDDLDFESYIIVPCKIIEITSILTETLSRVSFIVEGKNEAGYRWSERLDKWRIYASLEEAEKGRITQMEGNIESALRFEGSIGFKEKE